MTKSIDHSKSFLILKDAFLFCSAPAYPIKGEKKQCKQHIDHTYRISCEVHLMLRKKDICVIIFDFLPAPIPVSIL